MDYETIMPLLFRGTERLLIVAAATICIFLGYKLFKVAPSHRDGEGKFTFGDISLVLAKVGPGVFFALFGAFTLYQVVASNLHIGPQVSNNGREINWMVSADTAVWVERAPAHTRILNCLEKKASGTPLELQRIEDAIHSAKVAIIADIWQPTWGDLGVFRELSRGKVERESPYGEIYYALDDDC